MPHPGQAGGEYTYIASSTGFASASTASDILAIGGKTGGRSVSVKRIELTGRTTGVVDAVAVDVLAMKRSTADTTGTQVPLAMVPTNSGFPAAHSYATVFTANPGALGSLVGCVGAQRLVMSTTAAAANVPAVFTFTGDIHAVTLNSSDEQLCLSLNGVTIAGSALRVTVQVTERAT